MNPAARFPLFLLCLLLASCAATRVHLVTEGMDEAQVNRLQAVFDDSGYRVVLNDRPVPEQVKRPVLVYSPHHRDHSQLAQLQDLLKVLGYGVDLVPVSIGNNFYTGNNVGLYLRPYTAAAAEKTAAAGSVHEVVGKEFSGECPEADSYLSFAADGSFVLEVEGWNDTESRRTLRTLSGTWEQAEAGILLRTADQQFTFRLERFVDQLSVAGGAGTRQIAGIRLINPGASFTDCNFVFRSIIQL